MKGSIVVGLLCTLVCEVATLSCYRCPLDTEFQNCNQTKDCPRSCASITEALHEGGTEIVRYQKCCYEPDHCIAGSLNLGVSKRRISIECCDKDLCNTKKTPEFNTDNTPNGKTCFTCEDNDCTKSMSCVGNEDYCIKTTTESDGQITIMKGCASGTICKGDVSGLINSKVECCEGNLCNRPKGGRAQIALILVGSLLSVVIIILGGVLLGLHIRSRNKCSYCSTSSMEMPYIDK
ncbi:urokinase plasminogen activator surface receptor-like [Sardina pilchardus]|uniref:urokinase plasminogen activator surface receptor-like n=1 Tax=Sardina pilchardus TaxID=27697 RepID=UPI002E12994A